MLRPCPNCGAWVAGDECEYCGTEFVEKKKIRKRGFCLDEVLSDEPRYSIADCGRTIDGRIVKTRIPINEHDDRYI